MSNINFDFKYLKHCYLLKNNYDYYNSVSRENHLFEKQYKNIYYAINFIKEDIKKYYDKIFIFNNNLCFNKTFFNNNNTYIINLYKLIIDYNYRRPEQSKFEFEYKIIHINEKQELFEKNIIINKYNLIEFNKFTERRIIILCKKEYEKECENFYLNYIY